MSHEHRINRETKNEMEVLKKGMEAKMDGLKKAWKLIWMV